MARPTGLRTFRRPVGDPPTLGGWGELVREPRGRVPESAEGPSGDGYQSVQPAPCGLVEVALRTGEDIRVGVVGRDPRSSRYALFTPPTVGASGAPVRLRSDRSFLPRVLGHSGPLIANDLERVHFEEERALRREGFRAYVAMPLREPAGELRAVVFASRNPRRFDALTVGILTEGVERWRANGNAPAPEPHGAEEGPGARDETVVGQSPEFLEICRMAAVVARQETTVLIQGESGTGKELLAKTIHRYSRRAEYPFVRVNCAALAETLIESEMFGHRKGAFTGAIQEHKGRFEAADRGTLLLDEIGNMALAGQAKLLRVLQESEFEPVGQSSSVKVDVRIIATTNVDLERAIRDGAFREDLYYRLAVVPLTIPPLRARRRDILPLAEHFLRQSETKLGKVELTLSEEAQQLLHAHDWPGNARELRNAMEYAALVARNHDIGPDSLPGAITGTAVRGSARPATLKERLRQFEREIVLEAVARTGGKRAEVARILGVDPRNVSYFLRKHGIR